MIITIAAIMAWIAAIAYIPISDVLPGWAAPAQQLITAIAMTLTLIWTVSRRLDRHGVEYRLGYRHGLLDGADRR